MKTKDGKCTKLFYLIYSMPMIVYCLVVVLLGYVSYFAVNILGLFSLLIGNLLGSRIYLMEECIFTVLMMKQMAQPIVMGIV